MTSSSFGEYDARALAEITSEHIQFLLGQLRAPLVIDLTPDMLNHYISEEAGLQCRKNPVTTQDFVKPRLNHVSLFISGEPPLSQQPRYFGEMVEWLLLAQRRMGGKRIAVLAQLGDVWTPMRVPALVKTRPLADLGFGVLLPLNGARHYGSLKEVAKYDIPHNQKRAELMWRGASTGYPLAGRASRMRLVELYGARTDMNVGLSEFCQCVQGPPRWLKPRLSVAAQLKFRYLLSIEGNDVATNLKWMLASNSTVLMPVPTIEGWSMEGLLRAWEHYVPIQTDLADVAKQVEWCRQNPREAEKIAQHGQTWMRKYGFNVQLAVRVIQEYAKLVTFRVSRQHWGNRPLCCNVQLV
jgi:hypothetical protein